MSTKSDEKAVALLFQRPLEPVFTSRDNGKAAFDLPSSYYTEEYSGVGVELQSRFGDNVEVKIPLRDIKKPDLRFAEKLSKKTQFSLFNEQHKKIAAQLIELYMNAKDLSNFVSLAAYSKDRLNPFLFQYCFSVAVAHRKDTSKIEIPSIAETFPANFVEPSVIKDARAVGSLITNPGDRRHVEIRQNYTASDKEDEQRLFYFREDIGVNMHHWHWHLAYPTQGPREVVAKDRRGELFYYMHHQIIARYNVERIANFLAKVKPLNNLREQIPEAYFPKMLSSLNNRTYPGRVSNLTLQDINREDNAVEVADCERWTDRILAAIDQGFVTDTNGRQVPLDDMRGIDILGDLVEASSLSINPQLYGNVHNMGHNMIAFSHDPESRHLEDAGVMGDVTTAMRDPIFYRWHANIDNIFNKHKELLAPYNQSQIGFDGITVDYIEAKIKYKQFQTKANTLVTYWQKSDVDLAAALDFGPNGNIYARFTHLQHAPFEYLFNVTNTSGAPRKGTARVFICPKTDERNTPLKLNAQRLMAVELDKFDVDLKPGPNEIRRRSEESSVTIPFERSFRRIGADYQPKGAEELATFRFCGCGWPQHMLLPKGRPEGMAFDLFVMISNDVLGTGPDPCGKPASSFCGIKDSLYPDKRSMGFPFDRRFVNPTDTLSALTNTYRNMRMTDCTIIFQDKVA